MHYSFLLLVLIVCAIKNIKWCTGSFWLIIILLPSTIISARFHVIGVPFSERSNAFSPFLNRYLCAIKDIVRREIECCALTWISHFLTRFNNSTGTPDEGVQLPVPPVYNFSPTWMEQYFLSHFKIIANCIPKNSTGRLRESREPYIHAYTDGSQARIV